jgi:hypothetical protein
LNPIHQNFLDLLFLLTPGDYFRLRLRQIQMCPLGFRHRCHLRRPQLQLLYKKQNYFRGRLALMEKGRRFRNYQLPRLLQLLQLMQNLLQLQNLTQLKDHRRRHHLHGDHHRHHLQQLPSTQQKMVQLVLLDL